MLGVTIGIFSIVAVLSATYSLEKNIRSSVDKLGNNIVYVQKFPWVFSGSFKWWDYISRPEVQTKEFRRFVKDADEDIVQYSAFFFQFGSNTLKSKIEEINSVSVAGVEGEFFELNQWPIAFGRDFTDFEKDKGRNVCIIGYDLAVNLLTGSDPLSNKLKINGINCKIIGILDKKGSSMGGQNYDEMVLTTAGFARKFASPGKSGVQSSIMVKGYDDIDIDEMENEVNRIMRSIRKIRPKDKNNFAVNKLTLFSDALNQTFSVINLVGWLIGGFSLLVGGFGIANIMFVSVRERTSIIGLQKALGAKRFFIILQFLIESILLCLVGAFVGILAVIGLGTIVTTMTEFTIHFSPVIILQGTLVAVVIGLLAGITPALSAARLDPVEAIRR